MIVPMFPLPAVRLFPGQVMPLHIFEPRYRAMVEDLLDNAGLLVMATVAPEHRGDLQGAPPIDPVAGLGEIVQHERFPDGRFLIVLLGKSRTRITEVASPHPYRLVDVRPFDEVLPQGEAAKCLESEIRAALSSFGKDTAEIPAAAPLSHLIDVLLLKSRPGEKDQSDAFAEPDLARRGALALAAHRRGGQSSGNDER